MAAHLLPMIVVPCFPVTLGWWLLVSSVLRLSLLGCCLCFWLLGCWVAGCWVGAGLMVELKDKGAAPALLAPPLPLLCVVEMLR